MFIHVKLKLLLLQTEGNQPLESINPLTPNDLQRRCAVSLLNIKIPSKNMREKPTNTTIIHINEMHGSRSKIPSKTLVRQRSAERFNSGFKGLIIARRINMLRILTNKM
jgi:hypothetical protein